MKKNSEISSQNNINGHGFEKFVFELYSDLGYDVKLNQRITKEIDGIGINGQIDLIYNNFLITKYVECKYRSNSNVTFDDYSKFETTLKTFNIPLNFGEMTANTYFDPKVIARSKETGIKLVDIDELRKLSESRLNSFRLGIILYNFMECVENTGIINAVNNYRVKLMSLEDQIKFYSDDRTKSTV